MAQELTFNISEDRRNLQGPVEAKNFNLKFGTDGVAITHGNPKQWVQGRIGDNELKQVFVNITEGENNTPKDVAGLFLAFVGIIHDKDGRPHRVVDYKHSTTIDVEHGRFRFDFPDQAFTVAGEYQQAFFMLVKEGPGGGCVATMEFDMQVMANFVFTDLVPEDYITPFNDTVDQLLAACKKFKDDTAADEAKFKQELEDAYAKFQKDTNTQFNNFKDATDEDLANFKKANADDIAKFKQQYADAVKAKEDELQSKVDSYTDKIDTMLKDLNQQGIDTTTLLTTLQANIKSLEDKIKQDNLFTQAEADAFKQSIEDSVTNKLSDFQNVYKNDVAKMNSYIEELNQSDYRVLPYKMVSGTTDPIGSNGVITENQIEHLSTIGASLALIDMVNITSATDANPIKSDGKEMQRVVDLCKKHNVLIKMLKPHLGINWSDNFYRAEYKPSDVGTAMENWGNILVSYADFCNANNIPILCIECEQYILTQNKYLQYWTDIINKIKQKYPDLKLTVAYMNFEIVDPEHKDLLRQIDIIGLNLYPGFIIDDYSESLSVQYLVRSFYNPMGGANTAEIIDQVCDEFRKPAMLTETGCIATIKGLSKLVPSDYDANKGANHYEVTAYMMKAIFRFLQEDRNIIGFAWWHLNKPFNFFDGSSSIDNLSIAERTFKDYVERKLI